MANDLDCEVIGTGIVNITGKDGTVRAIEAVRYVTEARYNNIHRSAR